MIFFELEPSDISNLNDADLRELVARLCEAELIRQEIQTSCVLWGGAQEAADGGLDVRVVDAIPLLKPGFVSRENTGFQVKKNSMSKAACKNEMLDKGTIKTVIGDLLAKKGAYIIVSGKDDCSDKMLSERLMGMKSALEGLPDSEDLLLDFYGRDRLSAWLRQFPGVALWVRSRLGKPLSGWRPFGRWTSTPVDKDDEFLLDEHPCVIDMNSHHKKPIAILDGIRLVRERLQRSGSVVRITGLSGVGKTRFAQALFESDVCDNSLPRANVIYADLGDDLTPTASELVSYLIANDFSSYLVLDNCPPDVHRKLQKQVSSNQAKLSLLTIEYDISDDRPEETEVIHIEPSSEETVSKLIQKRFPSLGRVNADKVAEFSGGNARVAIALASRVGADETLANFTDEDLFQRLFNQRKGTTESLLESAEVLSLVYSFNVSPNEFNDELSALSRIGGFERDRLNRNHAELLRRQLSQKRGNWRAVLPHAVANRLARRALQNIDPDKINAELLKAENFRLFKSCAHRLGYMHDFEAARNLAHTWMKVDGPFHNIAQCNADLLTALTHIAPVFPDVVLTAIENTSEVQDFCSRNNQNFSTFVRLLRKIAYDDQYFDRAAGLILRFAETEKAGENNNSIANQLASLFSLYLSGTQATPARRHSFVNRMLNSGSLRYLEIAQEILRSAFKASHWSSFGGFDFGARSRDFGWEPTTNKEKLDWYVGYIELLVPFLDSENEPICNWAKAILANHFVGLWSYAGCFDILENIVRKYGAGGKWPDMWMAIKRTIHYNGKEHTPELFKRIEALEHLTAPADPYFEIEAYALTSTWEHIEIRGGDYTKNSEKIRQKIEKLGELASSEPDYLERLAPRLWEKHIDALWSFGNGLAKGSSDQALTFDTLVRLMQKQELEVVQPILFRGFIAGVHAGDPGLSRKLQESVLNVPELKQYFVDILSATPIAPWGTKKLIELAKSGELEAWRFQQISYGRVHESISDDDLSELLAALNDLADGIFSTIEILSMRFFTEKVSNYSPSDDLRSVGRQAILKLLSIHRDEINRRQLHGIDRVIEGCLSEPATENEIRDIINLLCNGIETYRLYGFELETFIAYLVQNYPEFVLDRVLIDSDNSEQLIYWLFKDRVHRSSSPLNLAPIERVLDWCNGNQDRIHKVAGAVSAYTPLDKESQLLDNPKKVVLSHHIASLLDAAENKAAIVETIFSRSFPNLWSGSLADILEVRAEAFAELLNHDSPEVREMAKTKLSHLNRSIRENREREAEQYNRREQRFE
ncbi:TPA: hypothetical protein ACIYP1_004542 [Escherichia coli]|nr:hypothetical protein NFK72_01310 [Escherichia coli]WFZ66726.1 hypothetical protein NFK73_01310 [Escherichia coli]WFZ71544.1 hypothetical protein NFK74_01310 [Escherichia coli]WFZ94801.1 hypothetical protein NFK81_01310 [Escherichia coli]WFZ99850.1 hypothetical protein NFK83_01310 [Escherichia coli]